jgi:hypothetical protein
LKRIFARGSVVVSGSKVFVHRRSGTFKMLTAKIVDGFLVCGPPDEIQAFHEDLSRTELNLLRPWLRVSVSSMNIVTENNGSTTIDGSHYLAACSPFI